MLADGLWDALWQNGRPMTHATRPEPDARRPEADPTWREADPTRREADPARPESDGSDRSDSTTDVGGHAAAPSPTASSPSGSPSPTEPSASTARPSPWRSVGGDPEGTDGRRSRIPAAAALLTVVAILVAVAVVAVSAFGQRPADPPSAASFAPSPSAVAATSGCGSGLAGGGTTGGSTAGSDTPERGPGAAARAEDAAPGDSPSVAPGVAESPNAGESPSIAAEIEEQIVAVEQTVPVIRRLEPTRAVSHRIIDPSALSRELAAMFEMDNPPELVAAQESLLKRLGLLPAEANLDTEVLQLLTEQVAAYYRPDTNEFVIVNRTGRFGPVDRVTVAHEYTHALQDQNFDLEKVQAADPGESDRGLARTALIEGDATLLMSLWAQANLDFEELGEIMGQALDPGVQATLADVPPVLCRQLLFPYQQGLTFALELFNGGGWDAINEAYRDPPDTTEQILHPDKYASREAGVDVVLPDLSRRVGAGWRRALDDTMGELFLQVWSEQGQDMQAAAVSASGWGGDRIAMYEGPGEAWAITWDTRWDTAGDASEFAAAGTAVLGKLPAGGRIAGTGAGDRVTILLANDDVTLRRFADLFLVPPG